MTILLLGGTGKTARRIAPRLRAAGATVRTAARSGADVRFDWDDTCTHDAALEGVDRRLPRAAVAAPGPRAAAWPRSSTARRPPASTTSRS